MCMVDDAVSWTVYAKQYPTARKLHWCDECGGPIRPGEEYHRARGLLDGQWDVFKMCKPCEDGPGRWLRIQCGGFLYHAVVMEAEDHWDDGYFGKPIGSDGVKVDGPQLGHEIIKARRRRHAGYELRKEMASG